MVVKSRLGSSDTVRAAGHAGPGDTHARTHAHIHTHARALARVHAPTHVCICTHTHTHTHTLQALRGRPLSFSEALSPRSSCTHWHWQATSDCDVTAARSHERRVATIKADSSPSSSSFFSLLLRVSPSLSPSLFSSLPPSLPPSTSLPLSLTESLSLSLALYLITSLRVSL